MSAQRSLFGSCPRLMDKRRSLFWLENQNHTRRTQRIREEREEQPEKALFEFSASSAKSLRS
jgi:hypothetical protein